MRTVVVVDDEPILRMDIAEMLQEEGFQVVGEAGDGFDAVEVCREQTPDVVLLDVKMPVFDGLTAAETIREEELAGCIVLLTAFDDREIIERAKNAGVNGYLLKPITQKMLKPTIEVAWAQSEQMRISQKEVAEAKRKLEENNLIQRARGILAKQEQITETEAYQLMRQMAMDKRISMAKLAEALIAQAKKVDIVFRTKERLMKEHGLTEQAAFKKIAELAKREKCTREEAAKIICDRWEDSHA